MPRCSTSLRLAAVLAFCVVLVGTARAADLSDQRAERRARVRAAVQAADKAGGGAPFGLLVIPVDFADARLPAGWQAPTELGPRLEGPGQTLTNYFAVASGGACDLRVTLAPLVSLPGTRRDYSDVGYNGFTRTRRLATEAVTAVRDLGLEFRRLDNDGPDGLAGTADDDGQVDGVLILHAGVGQENDLVNGLIQPLQFFLDEPVDQDGIAAAFYAVAAQGSGLGIWAHETAHLLGLEERYDLRYSAAGASEVHSRGGLGRFSLMAAGAWGSGAGLQPALPDAYSCWQLGWYEAVDLPGEGTVESVLTAAVHGRRVHRVWTHGLPDDEYFLLEVRQPVDGFDAAVPAGELLIYHVDESVPETAWSTVGGVHLRVQLVEADGDWALRDGLDEGSLADLYPGSSGASSFAPTTTPSSAGYRGSSAVTLADIRRLEQDGVAAIGCTVTASEGPAVRIELGFNGADPAAMDLAVLSVGAALDLISATVAAADPALGAFVGGGTQRTVALTEISPGRWTPSESVTWQSDPGLAPDAATRFVVTIVGDGWTAPTQSRTWSWQADAAALDFTGAWPGAWTIAQPDGDTRTTWQRWDDRSPLVPVGHFVLACAATADATGAAWPDVAYDNGAHTTLTSAPLGPGLGAVRLLHAWDTELLTGDVYMDGCAAVWVGPDGAEQAARPVDPWPGRIDGQALAALHGQAAWGGPGDLAADQQPVWRTDLLPLPADGPGPWRLRLVFASNTRDWDHRGWQIAAIEPVFGAAAASALPISWDAARLAWTWPAVPEGETVFTVQRLEESGWVDLLARAFVPPFSDAQFAIPADEVLAALPDRARTRSELRVVGPAAHDGAALLASGSVVVFPDGGDGAAISFSAPWPNPASDGVRFLVSVAPGAAARLRIYDVAGRLTASYDYPPGEHLARWDGSGPGGRRVAAGTYFLRLEGSNGVQTHKVVLLH